MIHVTLPQLCAYLDDELAEASAELVRRHLSECLECTERFGRLEEQDEALARILGDEPEEEFFQQLAASIPLGEPTKGAASAKKAVGKSKGETAPPALPRPPVSPRPERAAKPVAATPATAPAKQTVKPEPKPLAPPPAKPVVAAPPAKPKPVPRSPVVRTAAPVPKHPRRRAEDHEMSAMRAAVIAAVICCVVAASVAWVALRSRGAAPPRTEAAPGSNPSDASSETAPMPTPEELLERSAQPEPAETPSESAEPPAPSPSEAPPRESSRAPDPEPEPEKLVERAPQHFVPVRTVITETTIAPEESKPPEARTVPKPLPKASGEAAVREAKRASLDAADSKLPQAFDRSAEAWERALPLLDDAPEKLAMARREWSQARFQAWATEPTPARREAAISATREYLLYAPPGPERDQAWTWLGRLKH